MFSKSPGWQHDSNLVAKHKTYPDCCGNCGKKFTEHTILQWWHIGDKVTGKAIANCHYCKSQTNVKVGDVEVVKSNEF